MTDSLSIALNVFDIHAFDIHAFAVLVDETLSPR